jgi:hypothetical protein
MYSRRLKPFDNLRAGSAATPYKNLRPADSKSDDRIITLSFTLF